MLYFQWLVMLELSVLLLYRQLVMEHFLLNMGMSEVPLWIVKLSEVTVLIGERRRMILRVGFV